VTSKCSYATLAGKRYLLKISQELQKLLAFSLKENHEPKESREINVFLTHDGRCINFHKCWKKQQLSKIS
jgi:hypothetical protein